MTDSFDDLKIAPEVVAGVEAVGWDAPSGLQREATAVVRRGNNVVLHGSPGSGVVGAYGLGTLDRLVEADDDVGQPAVLILTPDAASAAATADSLARLAAPAGLVVRGPGQGWADRPAHLLVTTPAAALDAVRTSSLKLDGLTGVVIDGTDLMAGTGQWAALETMVDATPAGAQRILVTGRFDDAIDRFIEGHVRKAMTVPPRAEPDTSGGGPTVRYAVVPEADKPAATAHLLGDMDHDQVAVVCRTADRAAAAEQDLAARGVAGPADTRVLVLPRTEADTRSVQAGVISCDVPFDADEMVALHGNGGAVVVTPRERAHLLRTAARAGVRLSAVPVPAAGASPVDALRDRLRELADGDLAAELALLEPLLDELPAAELAAAAIRLAGGAAGAAAATGAIAAAGPSRGTAGAPAGAGSAGGRPGSAPPPDAGTWVHLFMSVGERDDAGPGDIVGAITGEAGVSGDQVGKIDIRESHSTVEVATSVAGRVIEALNGRTLKGRSLRVDYDRKDRGGGRRRDRG